MSEIRKGLLYSKDHEWVRIEDGLAYVGISDYAQEELGEIVYVELPELEESFERDDEISSIESVKAASAIINPLSGEVSEVNESLEDEPEKINTECYDTWIYALKYTDPSQLEDLLDEEGYAAFIASLSE